MAFSRIGFLTSVGGNPDGIGDYVHALDQAGIPAVVMANDGTTGLSDIWNLDTNVQHVMLFRVIRDGSDVPDYSKPPQEAASLHWNKIKAYFPPEIVAHRDRVWVQPINEVDKNRSDWLGYFGVEIAKIANAQGYKVALFAFASGEPEPEHWRTAGMLSYLQYCQANHDMAGVALHEYDYGMVGMANTYPWHVGRFQELFKACSEHSISKPLVFISELGWAYNDIPGQGQAMSDIAFAAELYARYTEVQGAALWYLGPGFGDIANKVQPLIQPVTAYTLSAVFPDPEEPMDTWQEQAAKIADDTQALAYKAGASLQTVPTSHGYQVFGNEFDFTRPDGVKIRMRGAIHPTTAQRRYYWVPIPQWGNVSWYELPLPGPVSPLDGLVIGAPFRLPFVLTSPFNSPRDYGNLKHEGTDYDIVGQPSNSTEPVLCGYDGVVYRSENNNTAYGHFVVTQHENNGFTFYIWYCHMDKRFVVPGQVIKKGDPVGELGATGGNWGEHIHINLQVPGFGLAGYVVSDVVDPAPFVSMTPAVPPGLDLRRFMIADKTAWRVVRSTGGQEDIQDMDLGNGLFVRRKNALGEWWWVDGSFFYLVHDTSPDKDSQGNERIYTLTKNGVPGAPKNPLFMSVGQSWQEQGTHHVQFRGKNNNCQPLSENSGFATNTAVLTSHKINHTFNAYGQNLTVDEAVWIKTGSEEQIYARKDGKAIGWCGWSAPWGQSEIVELYWNRPPMTQEPNRYCSW